jgi:hypothetical protein
MFNRSATSLSPGSRHRGRQGRRAAGEEGILGRSHPRQWIRRLEDPTGRVGVDQERLELIAEPQRAIRGDAHRFDVEVTTGQQTVAANVRIDGDRICFSSDFYMRETNDENLEHAVH